MANTKENLVQFTSETGRSAGRKSKRGVSIKTELKRLLSSGEVDVKELGKNIFEHVKNGNSGFLRVVMEYLEDKEPGSLIALNEDGEPIQNNTIKIEFVEPKERIENTDKT